MKYLLLFFFSLLLSSSIDAQENMPPTRQQISLLNADRLVPLEQATAVDRGRLYDVAWSPDGETIAVASASGIWLYHMSQPSMEPLFVRSEDGIVWMVAYSPDGRYLASFASDVFGTGTAKIKILDAATNLPVVVLPANESFSFSPDSKLIAYVTPESDVVL